MRILLTGMMKVQSKFPRKNFYGSGIVALNHMLTSRGHKVDWRRIEYGETRLDRKYDLVIIGLGAPGDFSCCFLHTCIMASAYENVVYLIDDWRANGAIRSILSCDLGRDFLLKINSGKYVERQQLKKDLPRLEKLRAAMFKKRILFGSMWEWGDRSILLEDTPFEECYHYDPSPFLLKYRLHNVKPLPMRDRKKRWIFGALKSYARWIKNLGASWPVIEHCRKNGNFLPEPVLVEQEYTQSIGVLAPSYQASGSGWWRPRYLHALAAGCIMHGDETEGKLIHKKYWRPIEEIEEMSSSARKQLLAFQYETLLSRLPKLKEETDRVDAMFDEFKEKVG